MGFLLTGIVATASPLVASFYGKPELAAVTFCLSANFLIGSISSQHGAMLVRKMQFIRKAIATITGSLANLVVAIIFASKGYSYWALVWGTLTGSLITTTLLLTLSPFRPCLPTAGSGIREMLGFGANITAFDFVNYFSRNLDNILIGRFRGTQELGFYCRAYSLLMLPIVAIRSPIISVAFPVMSQLQDNPHAYRTYYRRVILVLSHLTMPLVAFLFISSETFIEVTLGAKWKNTSPIFSILAITAFIQSPLSVTGLIQLTLGRGKRYLYIGSAVAAFTSLGFCIGVSWGAIGVAIAYAITTYTSLLPVLLWAFKDTPLSLMDFFENIFRPGFVSTIAASITFVLSLSFQKASPLILLSSMAIIFSFFYIVIMFCIPHGKADMHWAFSNIKYIFKVR